ncbi:ATP-binding protein [Streptomyces sp. J2-1]|uniref:ATP-binding protein n=1 Tax=Streptomyces corallincola TaxID=2851888 RepID=UPI001C37F2EA|nr:ATP-binding protein [Streptomyces corallincola]MBV2353282.1 ATP-binding protein [Streptomyces corallincola]
MDPIIPGAEDHGRALSRRPPRDSLATDFGQAAPAPVRTARVVTGDLLLTVNPVDGSEVEPCPPYARPDTPRRRAGADRADAERAARPPVPPGPARPASGLLERQEDREHLVRLLVRGRSVRLTGPGGSGRTALLDLVAEDSADLAPDGVIRLSGFHRTADDLLHDLFHAAYDAPGLHPTGDQLAALVGEIGAVVVVDDLEFGGPALTGLLDATPECAYLFAATPDVPAPAADCDIDEVALAGLDRAAGVEILERAVGRVLTEEESNWAGDVWFESEGLPLRFVQAGALLRQREQLRASTGAVDEYGVFEVVLPPVDAPLDPAEDESAPPLPSLGEAAGPAPLLAARLSAAARATLRFAVALGGEVPHQAHLPALVGDTHADAALGELADCGLVSPVGSRHRLAAGVLTQLEAAGYGADAPADATAAAEHYVWWTGHPSVTPERISAEADAVLAALAAVAPLAGPADADGSDGPDERDLALRLARTAAPAFAAGLRWSAWEHALRSGGEAALLAGDLSAQVYFHHELGVLALCSGELDRARAELETSGGLRGALTDKRGAVAGLRALALVADLSGVAPAPAAEEAHEAARPKEPVAALPVSTAHPLYAPVPDADATRRLPAAPGAQRGGIRRLARRNFVAAGSGALLAAVLGTVVTLGMTSGAGDGKDPAGRVEVDPTVGQDPGDSVLGANPGESNSPRRAPASPSTSPTDPGPDGTFGTADDPTPTSTRSATVPPSTATGTRGAGESGGPGGSGGSHGAATPTKSRPSTSTKPGSPPPDTPSTSADPSDSGEPSTSPSESPSPPQTSTSASDVSSGPVSTGPVSTGSVGTGPASTGVPA